MKMYKNFTQSTQFPSIAKRSIVWKRVPLHIPYLSLVANIVVDGDYLPVSQRRDDKPVSAAKEFILITEVNISDGHNALIQIFVEVKSWLF